MSGTEVFDIGRNITIVGGVLFILWAGYREIWVWGRQLREVKRERDELRELLYHTTRTARKAANKLVEQRAKQLDELEAYGDDEIA